MRRASRGTRDKNAATAPPRPPRAARARRADSDRRGRSRCGGGRAWRWQPAWRVLSAAAVYDDRGSRVWQRPPRASPSRLSHARCERASLRACLATAPFVCPVCATGASPAHRRSLTRAQEASALHPDADVVSAAHGRHKLPAHDAAAAPRPRAAAPPSPRPNGAGAAAAADGFAWRVLPAVARQGLGRPRTAAPRAHVSSCLFHAASSRACARAGHRTISFGESY